MWVTGAQPPAATDRNALLGSLAASVLMSGALAVTPPAALALTTEYANSTWAAHQTATIAAAYPEVSAGDAIPLPAPLVWQSSCSYLLLAWAGLRTKLSAPGSVAAA